MILPRSSDLGVSSRLLLDPSSLGQHIEAVVHLTKLALAVNVGVVLRRQLHQTVMLAGSPVPFRLQLSKVAAIREDLARTGGRRCG